MASVAAAAYSAQARDQRSIDALGDLDPETREKVNAALEEQSRLNLQLMPDADQRRIRESAANQDRTARSAVDSLEREGLPEDRAIPGKKPAQVSRHNFFYGPFLGSEPMPHRTFRERSNG